MGKSPVKSTAYLTQKVLANHGHFFNYQSSSPHQGVIIGVHWDVECSVWQCIW